MDAFEREAADYIVSAGALALTSGTATIHLVLRYLGVKRGDPVFCSSLTFIGSANPILYQGAEPVFIDAEPASWNMSPAALERALSDAKKAAKLPKAVIIANLYGQSADFDPLLELCDAYKVPALEDAAESLGATYKGKAGGTFGVFGIFSFNGNKIITTSGGGMIVSDNLEALRTMRFWATQARDPAPHYQHTEMGYNYRLSNVLAAIGRGQMRVLDERVNACRSVFDRYVEALGDIDGLDFMPEAPYGRSNRWLTVMTLDPTRIAVTPYQLMEALEAENIEARPVWKPLHVQPLFEGMPYYPHTPNNSVSDRLFAQGLCLPSGSNLTESQQERVIRLVRRELGIGNATTN